MSAPSGVRIVDHRDMDLSAALMVVAFPGVGLVGTIAASFLTETFELERIASAESRSFPPMAVLQGGRAVSPVRVHAAPMVCGVDGRCDQLAVLAAEVMPKGELLYDLCQALLDWCQGQQVQEMVILEGFARPEGVEETAVYGVGNSERTLQRLRDMGVQSLEEGILSGTAGPLAYLAEARGFDVTVLLAETAREYPDARAAARLLEVLDPIVPQIDIETEPLYQRAEVIEGRLKSEFQRHRDSVKDMTERSRIMYG